MSHWSFTNGTHWVVTRANELLMVSVLVGRPIVILRRSCRKRIVHGKYFALVDLGLEPRKGYLNMLTGEGLYFNRSAAE